MRDDALRAERDVVVSTDAIMRASAMLGLVGIAVIHFSQVVQTMQQTRWLGTGFAALILAGGFLAARLLRRGTRSVWLQVAGLNLVAIGGFVFTRIASTALDNQDVGNWSQSVGLAALLVEALLLALSLYALSRPDSPRPPGE